MQKATLHARQSYAPCAASLHNENASPLAPPSHVSHIEGYLLLLPVHGAMQNEIPAGGAYLCMAKTTVPIPHFHLLSGFFLNYMPGNRMSFLFYL
ncbi:hypothetical protein [Acinetobacter baumannii]|uniref:hypothetical protein n=1 Tax=Acinetobacter baumannii TaxID=470 RepID=UPI000708A53F|nr:hypothetical protein [Acinetobacter baumannii]KRI55188.1 hypothetical protein APC20_14145 [Acinetobacter baumannii]